MLGQFSSSLGAYGAAVSHISKHRMWGYVLLPGFLSVLVAVAVFGTAWGLSDDLGDWIDGIWVWDWGRTVVEMIAQVLGGLMILALGLVFFKQLIMVLLSPFMSLLSEKVESQLLGKQSTRAFTMANALSDIARGLRLAIRNIARELLLTLGLLVLGLIPVFTPFTTTLIFLLQSYYAGFGNIDFTLERHFNYRDSIRFVHKNRGMAFGNGMIFMALLLSFVGFLFALPLGTVAATINTVKRINREKPGFLQ